MNLLFESWVRWQSVADFGFISAFVHVSWAVNSHAIQFQNFYQLSFPEFDVNVFLGF